MAEEKVIIKAKVAQKIISDGDTSYSPLKGELVAVNKVDNNNNNHFSLAIGQEKEGSNELTELQELNYVEGKANTFYVTAGQKAETPLGANATAEGNGVAASGVNSHAEGLNTVASGANSHAEGHGTIATGANSHVFGKYNLQDSQGNYIEIVGKGDENTRSNARTLDWNGNEVLAGKLTIEGNKDVATKEYVDSTQKIVTSDDPGLAPKIESTAKKNLVLGCVYNNDNGKYTAQWLEFGTEGITVNSVSADTDGIVPKYGNEQKKRVLIVTANNRVEWVEASELGKVVAADEEIEGVYLESKNGILTWSVPVIIDNASYDTLKAAINNPIDFIPTP